MIGIPAVAIYLPVVFLATEIGKRWFKVKAIYFSWVVGALCYVLLALLDWFMMDSILYYLILFRGSRNVGGASNDQKEES